MNHSNDISDIELEAAEYVLGHGSEADRDSTTQQLIANPELRQWVHWWEQRLYPLALHPKPASPRKSVWEALTKQVSVDNKNPNGDRGVNKLWRLWGIGASMVATASVLLLTFTLLGNVNQEREMPTHYASLESNGMMSHIVECYQDGRFEITAVHPATATDGKVLELWMVAANTAPASLGILPSQGRMQKASLPMMQNTSGKLMLAVSVEPAGGSPTGQPTGPVINSTQLIERTSSNSVSF